MSYKNLSVCCVYCKKETKTSGLSNHYNRVHGTDEELKIRLHLANIESGKTASLKAAEKSLKQCKEYYSKPNFCKQCNSELDFFKRKLKFCTKSCSASNSNNKRPPRSAESKAKTSKSLRESTKRTTRTGGSSKNHCSIVFHKCTQCDCIVLSRGTAPKRKTCSKECQTHASVGCRTYQNGKRKNIYYKTLTGETVLLESSWELELAKFLDANSIEWERPTYIKWTDSTGKQRNYYPDFYLPKYDLYLDPKNPYAMVMDANKMLIVSTIINILYGDKDSIKSKIIELL